MLVLRNYRCLNEYVRLGVLTAQERDGLDVRDLTLEDLVSRGRLTESQALVLTDVNARCDCEAEAQRPLARASGPRPLLDGVTERLRGLLRRLWLTEGKNAVPVANVESLPAGANTLGAIVVIDGAAGQNKGGVNAAGQVAVAVGTTVPPSDRSASATLTALTQTVSLNTQGLGSVGVQIAGTFTGTLSFQGTSDGVNWSPINGMATGSGGPSGYSNSTSSIGTYQLAVAGLQLVRVLVSGSIWSGSVLVTLEGSGAAPAPLPLLTVEGNTSSTAVPVVATDRTTSGNANALNSFVSMVTQGIGTVGLTVTGTWVGTLSFQGTIDGTNWFAINGYAAQSVIPVQSITANGQYFLPSAGLLQVRVLMSAFTSGTAVVTGEGNQVPNTMNITAMPAGQNSTKRTYSVAFQGNYTTPQDVAALVFGTGTIRIRRIVFTSVGIQGTAAIDSLQLRRFTTVGSGGSPYVPAPYDPSDAAFSGVARTGDTTISTGTTLVTQIALNVPATYGATAPYEITFGGSNQIDKCPMPASVTGAGIALYHPGATGAASMSGFIEFTEE